MIMRRANFDVIAAQERIRKNRKICIACRCFIPLVFCSLCCVVIIKSTKTILLIVLITTQQKKIKYVYAIKTTFRWQKK
jgi:hypothetical protein